LAYWNLYGKEGETDMYYASGKLRVQYKIGKWVTATLMGKYAQKWIGSHQVFSIHKCNFTDAPLGTVMARKVKLI